MNNYTIRHSPGTSAAGAIISAGIVLVSALIAMPPSTEQDSQQTISLLNNSPARIIESSNTSGQYENVFTGEYEGSMISFEETVVSFYEQLLKVQEPLGQEFEQVLHDNLWDLMVRT